MNDLERELRELLGRRFDEVSVPPVASKQVLRGVRRRQVGVAIVGGTMALLVAIGSLVGIRALLLGRSGSTPESPGSEKTSTAAGVTITYPAAWTFLDLSSSSTTSSEGWILAVASNGGLQALSTICQGQPTGVPGDAVVLSVQQDGFVSGGPDVGPPWPVPLRATTANQQCGPGWGLYSAQWTAEGRLFRATAGLGPRASSADRDALFAAFAGMRFASIPQPSESTRYVVASGEAAGLRWTLLVQTGGSICAEVESGSSGAESCSATAPGQGPPPGLQVFPFPNTTPNDPGLLYGSLPQGATAVQATLEDGSTVSGQVYPSPAGLGFPGDLFVIQVQAGASGEVQALDGQGKVLASERFVPPPLAGATI